MQQTLNTLARDLHQCMRQDFWPLRKRLDRLRTQLKANRDIKETLATLSKACEQSKKLRTERAKNIPKLTYPDLPVVDKKQVIGDAIKKHQVVILCGETGSGKTTQLPKICLEIGRGCAGLIGHTQPRRIAARSVADRIAEELGETLGHSVGFKIRFQDHTKPEAYIKLMTDGILLAEIQGDPYLNQYDTLILDEAHERSLNIDFLMGYLKWLLPKRRDLKLIVTSATIDPERFSKHFDDAPIIMVSGRTYPVEMRYRPLGVESEEETSKDLQQGILDAVDELHRVQSGDILLFLTGERDIRETTEALRKHNPGHAEILPLYAKLSSAEQQKIFKPKGQRRIILTTNVAETSLTVPRIHAVIDAGYARISRYSHRSKLQRLPIEKISQASAQQRSGRCGRIGPGICIRLYSEEDFKSRPEFTEPEILRTNLAAVILQMKTLKLADISQFPFVEPPSNSMIQDGLKLLHELNALDDVKQRLTRLGQKLARLPLDPRLGRMLLAAEQEGCLSEVAVIVAGLSIQDPKERPLDQAQAADQKHARYKDAGSDFVGLLKLWQDFHEQKKHLTQNKLRKYCRSSFISYMRMREWMDIHQQVMQVVKGDLKMKPNGNEAEPPQIHRALLSGLLSNTGFKLDKSEYQGARNQKFQIFPGSGLFKSRPKWVMAAEQVETSKVYARITAKIEPEWIEQYAGHLVKREHYEPLWEKKPARVAIHEKVSLYGMVLSSQRKIPCENIDPVLARELFIRFALVQYEYDCRANFFKKNKALIESVELLQHKGRRVDLLVDDEQLYQFYDSRLPASVCNGITFDQWRKQAERKQPDLLIMTRGDLVRKEDETIGQAYFPDQIQTNKIQIDLDYKFKPGDQADGVTTVISLHQLNQLKAETFEWLVPGLLREKIIALIKALPKQLRKQFVPAPDYADRCMPYLESGEGSLHTVLIHSLRRLTGVTLADDVWNDVVLPEHLLMNFQLVDENDQLLDQSRSLSDLQTRHAALAGEKFQALAANTLTHSGCEDWTFGDLANQHDAHDQGFSGYPAVIDEGETIGVRLFDVEAKAAQAHHQGLLCLLRLRLTKEIKYLHKQLPFSTKHELIYSRLPQHPFLSDVVSGHGQLIPETITLALTTTFLSEATDIRSKALFDARLQAKKQNLLSIGNEIASLIISNLETCQTLSHKLAVVPETLTSAEDITEQLDALFYQGFIETSTFENLKAYPRYLKAISHRMEKMLSDPVGDQQKLQQLLPYWKQYWDQQKAISAHADRLQQQAFRWGLEEFRVSLFAQMVKTAYPISAKRLEKLWEKSV